MAFSDARNERDRAETGRNSSNHGGGDARAAADRNRAAMGFSGGGFGNMGGGSFVGGTGLTRDKMRKQDQIGANVSKALNDQRGVGDSFWDKAWNALAGTVGFNEMDPTRPGYSKPGRPGTTGKADWGFDPAGAIGGAAGLAFGFPGLGMATDYLSSLAGRPLEINMGPEVFSGVPGSPPSLAGGTGNNQGYSPFNSPVAALQPAKPAQSVAAQTPQGMRMPSIYDQFRNIPGPSQYGVYTPFLG